MLDWTYFASNPSIVASAISVFGTLTVGALTLFGVWLTLRFNRGKMVAEMKAAEHAASAARDFSADQARRSHLTDLRKSLYATLVEEHQRAIALLFGMSNMSLAEAASAPEKLHSYAAAVQKTMIISEGQTSRLAREVHAKVMEAVFDVFPFVVPLAASREHLAKANAELREHYEASQTLLERERVTPKAEVEALRDLGALAEAIRVASEVSLAKRNALADQYNDKFAEFQTAANGHARRFAVTHTEFLSLARAELGIVGDPIDALETQAMFDRAQSALKRLKSAIGLPERAE